MSHIIAVDESESAEKAFDFAHNNLPKEDKFIIFHGRPLWAKAPFAANSQHAQEKEKFEMMIGKFERKCQESSRNCEFVNVWIKSPSDVSYWVNANVENSKAKSIVVGARGISGLERMILGSVSHSILNGASVPVIITKSEDKKAYAGVSDDKIPIM